MQPRKVLWSLTASAKGPFQDSKELKMKVWKSSKHANGEPNSDNHLGAFYVTCFAHGVWLFYSCGKRVATWSSRCAL